MPWAVHDPLLEPRLRPVGIVDAAIGVMVERQNGAGRFFNRMKVSFPQLFGWFSRLEVYELTPRIEN